MSLLFFCNNHASRRRARYIGVAETADLWRAWARYRMLVRARGTVSQPGSPTNQHITTWAAPTTPPTDAGMATTRYARSLWGQEQAKRPVGRSLMRPDGSSGRRWWVGMTRGVPGWLGPSIWWSYLVGVPGSNSVFRTRARAGREGGWMRVQDRLLVASSRQPTYTISSVGTYLG